MVEPDSRPTCSFCPAHTRDELVVRDERGHRAIVEPACGACSRRVQAAIKRVTDEAARLLAGPKRAPGDVIAANRQLFAAIERTVASMRGST